MSAAAPPKPAPRPNLLWLLARDAGPAVVGAAVIYPGLWFAIGGMLPSGTAPEGGSSPAARAAGLCAGAVLVLVFGGALWLTGPRSMIGRWLVLLALAGAILFTLAVEAGGNVAMQGRVAPLAAILGVFALLLMAAGWFVRCWGGGRAAQYATAALLGTLLVSTMPLVRPALKLAGPESAGGSGLAAAQRIVVDWFARTHPMVACFETVGYAAWLNNRSFADYETGEAFLENLGVGEAGRPAGSLWLRSVPVHLAPAGILWGLGSLAVMLRKKAAARRAME